MRSRSFAVASVIALAIACATNPATGRHQLILMSEAEEIALGQKSDVEIRQQMGVYDDQAVQRYVDGIGQRLASKSYRPSLKWTFTVVDESAVNAFALPGGFIYVTRGILPFLRNEAELSGVVGHEVGHVDAKHSVDQYSKQMLAGGALAGASILAPEYRTAFGAGGLVAGLAFLKFGRDAELEADRLGVRYASAAGWAPQAMPGVLGTLGRLDAAQGSSRGVPNWALTHPPAEDRIAKVQEAVAAAASLGGTATNAAEFDRVIDGIVVGDSREKGMVRGSEFVHPIMRFSLKFPENWEITNGSDQVSAVENDQGRVAMLLEISKSASSSPAEAARADMSKAGFTETSGGATRINGLDAYVGTYEATSDTTRIIVRAAHIRSGNSTYLVAGLAAASDFPRVDGMFGATIQSFRQLSQQEADRIQPARVDFYTVRTGDSWDSLARQAGGSIKASSLAIMNGSDPATAPRAGSRIRIVVGG
jgi:predicted Zn-dependent protease